MPPMARLPKLLWLTGLSVVLASAVLPGCGDDDGSDEPGEETGGMAGATGGKGGGTTGGKGGATGGKGGATGGSTQGGEAGAPVGTGGAPVATGGAGGADIGGAGAGGAPVVGGGGGAGGEPDVGGAGAGGTSGGAGDGGVGGAGEGGTGGSDEVTGGTGGDDGVGGEGGEGGAGEVVLVSCSESVANSESPPYTDGIGLDCEDICAAFATGACDDDSPYASQAACLAECTARPEIDICCRATHAAAAATDGDANVERHCAAAAGDEFEGALTCN